MKKRNIIAITLIALCLIGISALAKEDEHTCENMCSQQLLFDVEAENEGQFTRSDCSHEWSSPSNAVKTWRCVRHSNCTVIQTYDRSTCKKCGAVRMTNVKTEHTNP